jgi:hypothetical protein
MRRPATHLALALLCGLGAASYAGAQGTVGQYTPPYQPRTPQFSPYLNMMRPGVNPALNYYGMVRPQQEATRGLQNLNTQLQQLDNTVLNSGMTAGAPTAGSMLTTGHPVVFMNYGSYFPGRGGGAGMVRGRAGGLGGMNGTGGILGPVFGNNTGIGVGIIAR